MSNPKEFVKNTLGTVNTISGFNLFIITKKKCDI